MEKLIGLITLLSIAGSVFGITIWILRRYYSASHRGAVRKALEDKSLSVSQTLDIILAEEVPRWLKWLIRVNETIK